MRASPGEIGFWLKVQRSLSLSFFHSLSLLRVSQFFKIRNCESSKVTLQNLPIKLAQILISQTTGSKTGNDQQPWVLLDLVVPGSYLDFTFPVFNPASSHSNGQYV